MVDSETKLKLINSRLLEKDDHFAATFYKGTLEKSGIKRRCCSRGWFDSYDFISYSKQHDGLCCLYCILFPVTPTSGSRAKALISQPYCNWKDAVSNLKHHSGLQYHLSSKNLMAGFLNTSKTPTDDIANRMSAERERLLQKNIKFLHSL